MGGIDQRKSDQSTLSKSKQGCRLHMFFLLLPEYGEQGKHVLMTIPKQIFLQKYPWKLVAMHVNSPQLQ